MGPKAAGLSRSMGGAAWSPWPWPLSAQAGPYLSLFLIPDSHSIIRRFRVRPTSPTKPAARFLRLAQLRKGGKGGGAVL